MILQNCPKCGANPFEITPGLCHCGNQKDGMWNCKLAYLAFTYEEWNRLRFAPNDKDVIKTFIGNEENSITEWQEWMNPVITREKECEL